MYNFSIVGWGSVTRSMCSSEDRAHDDLDVEGGSNARRSSH